MIYYAIKAIVSAMLIAVVSEVSKRGSSWGGTIASLPLVSLIALDQDLMKVAALARSTFWFVLPSLAFFGFSRRDHRERGVLRFHGLHPQKILE